MKLVAMFLVSTVLASLVASKNIAKRGDSVSSKAGIAWINGGFDYKQFTTTKKVTWYYTWDYTSLGMDIEFVPMLHDPSRLDGFNKSMPSLVANGSVKAILGLNEPERPDQANTTASQAAQIWKDLVTSGWQSKGVLLGSPAVSSAPEGAQWLVDYFSNCTSCNPDFLAIHWYGDDANKFQTYLNKMHSTYPQYKIWVTEWACVNSKDGRSCDNQDDVNNFLKESQTFMDNTNWIDRYSWFGIANVPPGGISKTSAMLTEDKINALGQQYISAVGSTSSSQSGVGQTTSATPP
ncbi:hypothetical protein BD410DRAFT_838812 [Rickenella mellea]|uniref:Asl1-like glycosyl hydrolase catalytic domain-containing protein n=1 Tax=Rickenella mellea TaxID=50990 RepID=A0A4Y7Q9C2_9AGAM|nr:hypothetical protein BD410DRAFT_838812 [Rickenella mellea]